MVYAGALTGAGVPGQFIYVWPSRDLIALSWSWPAAWHDAFQDAATRVALAVGIHASDGHRLTRRLISLRLSIGAIKFRVERRGASLYITVVAFTGPDHSPDSPDGARQPSAVEGLILGLHGSGNDAYLVVFHGHAPFACAYRPGQPRQLRPVGAEQGNSPGDSKFETDHGLKGILRRGSRRDIVLEKLPAFRDGDASRAHGAAAHEPGMASAARPRRDWMKETMRASREMKNGCFNRLGLARANSQPILVLVDRGGGGGPSVLRRLPGEKHLFSHVLSKRLH